MMSGAKRGWEEVGWGEPKGAISEVVVQKCRMRRQQQSAVDSWAGSYCIGGAMAARLRQKGAWEVLNAGRLVRRWNNEGWLLTVGVRRPAAQDN
jgi:hypothetical protein